MITKPLEAVTDKKPKIDFQVRRGWSIDDVFWEDRMAIIFGITVANTVGLIGIGLVILHSIL